MWCVYSSSYLVYRIHSDYGTKKNDLTARWCYKKKDLSPDRRSSTADRARICSVYTTRH